MTRHPPPARPTRRSAVVASKEGCPGRRRRVVRVAIGNAYGALCPLPHRETARGRATPELDRRRRTWRVALGRFHGALLDPVEPAPPQRGKLNRPVQQHLRYHDGGEEADRNTDPQREREALHRARAELEEDRGGEHRGQVRVEDRRERALAAFLDGDAE